VSKEIKLDIWPSYNIKHRLDRDRGLMYSLVEELARVASTGSLGSKTHTTEYAYITQTLEDAISEYYATHDEIQQLNYIHRVCMMGAEKYGLGMYLTHKFSFKARINSALRHIVKSQKEDFDSESGLPHLYHTLANVYMIGEVLLEGSEEKIKESNDLPKREEDIKVETVTDVFEAMGLESPKLNLLGGHYDESEEGGA